MISWRYQGQKWCINCCWVAWFNPHAMLQPCSTRILLKISKSTCSSYLFVQVALPICGKNTTNSWNCNENPKFSPKLSFLPVKPMKNDIFFSQNPPFFLGLGWNRHHLGFLLSFNGGRSSHLMTAVVATPSKSPDLVARFRWNWHFRDEKFDVHPSCFIEKPQNAMSKACEWSQVATLQYHKIPRVCCWLVVDLPLWKIWKSNGSIIPNIWKNKSHVPNHQPGWIWVKIHGFPTAYGHWFGFHGFHAPEFTQQMATF